LSTISSEIPVSSIAEHGYQYACLISRNRRTSTSIPDRTEEFANTITHGAGLVLSLAGLYSLVLIAAEGRRPGLALGCGIYGVSLVLLYAASTLYHGWQAAGVKRVLLLLDHIAIYVLIAGTYTPVALLPLRGTVGQGLLVLVWGFALVGSIAKVVRIDRIHEDSPMPYIVMGGMVTGVIERLGATAPPAGLLWLLAGGGLYVIGLRFFLRNDRRFNHAIWHLFVLAGSICHYWAVIAFVRSTPA
jgi:hemolysin III